MATTVHAAQGAAPSPWQPGFNSPPMVRWLGSLAQGGDAPAMASLPERLSQWLDWTDAIALAAALNAGVDAAPVPPTNPPTSPLTSPLTNPVPKAQARSPHDACQRVRRALARQIDQDAALRSETATVDSAQGASFAPFRSHCRALQRTMEARIGALRADVRAALAAQSADLARLADLDAVLAQALAARTQHLLSTLPDRLEQQYSHLPADQRPGFHQQVRSVLHAELDLRFQPIEGLLEALGPPPSPRP